MLMWTWMPLLPALLMTLGQVDPSLLACCLCLMENGRQSLCCSTASALPLLARFWVLPPCLKQQDQRWSRLPVQPRCQDSFAALEESCETLLPDLRELWREL